jgi:hypothetical protein
MEVCHSFLWFIQGILKKQTLPYLHPSTHKINKSHDKSVGSLTVQKILKALAIGVAYVKKQN